MRSFSLAFLLIIAFCAGTTNAAETRGLRVVAKDSASNKVGEVRLYNKTYAVIIGIDKYPYLPPDRQLLNAVKDAEGVQEVLNKHYQFDKIITLYNDQATKDRIMEVLTEELPAQMGKDDALFLFWAGHGNQEKSDYGDLGYLIPFDGSVDKIRKNLTMAEIRDTISKKIPAKHVFYVMDACYSGLLTSRSVDNKTRRDLAYLKGITKESVRQVLTAGGKNEEALDGGPKGHSVFTGRFIEILENANDFITANEIQAFIKERVYSDAKARNHTQTPGFGPLYGLGDFVFVPKQTDKLGELAGESASRKKELEQLRKAEVEAEEAKKRELAEIVQKEAELSALDKQIAEMKRRLGSNSARSDDSLDQLMALAEQKNEQGKRLEDLRQQREAEERKRLSEIEQLKREAKAKQADNVKSDLAKYEKIASNKYAQDMKGAAWRALIAGYPEAKTVLAGNVKGFLEALGLIRENDDIVPIKQKVIVDEQTGLMWARNGTLADKKMNWSDSKVWVKNLNYLGYSDWRLPTKKELVSFSKQGGNRSSEYFNAKEHNNDQDNFYWSSSTVVSDTKCAWFVQWGGGAGYYDKSSFYGYIWPVRDVKKINSVKAPGRKR